MNRDLETLLREDAGSWRRPAPIDLPQRVHDTIAALPTRRRTRWPVITGVSTLAAAALILLMVTLQPDPTSIPSGPSADRSLPALFELPGPVPAQPLRQGEDLLLREVVLMQQDAENAIDFVLQRIPERVRPLVMLDRML